MKRFLYIATIALLLFSQGLFASAQTVFPNRGGSGTTTITGLLRGNGTSPYTTITDGSSGQVLTTDGADGYSFQSIIKTLAAVSAASTDATKSLYQMSSTIPVEFRASDTSTLLYLDETNKRIGVGTSSPTDFLSIYGNSATRIGTTWINTNSSPATSAFLGAYSGNMQMGTVSNHPFYLETNNTVRIAIAAAGNIGIGLNSGSAKLHVLATTEQLRLGYDASNYVPFTVSSGGLLGIIPTGGMVGIGTNAPVEKLHVSNGVNTDSGTVTFLIGGSNGANARTGRIIKDTTTPYTMTIRSGDYAGTGLGSDLRFQTNNGDGDRITIKGGTGNTGIGVTAPTAVLHLKAGTATASTAPLKFTSGTNLTTAEAGAMEYNGTSLFFTRTGTQRETVSTVVTKTDTGDGTGAEGLLQINTFDNTYKVYAEGAWRTIVTW